MGDRTEAPGIASLPTRTGWIGLVIALAGCALQLATASAQKTDWYQLAGAIAVVLSVVSVIVAGYAVSVRPRNRLIIAIASLTCFTATLGIRDQWNSIRLLPGVMSWVGVAAIFVLSLPRTMQRLVASGIVVFHFLGVLSAITSPPPQSWLTNKAWMYVFRPHLMFVYANNAYQFYSPEPGPASLLWCCIELQQGEQTQKVWYKLPRKPETHLDPLAIEFFRRLSITEATNQTYNNGPTVQAAERRNLVAHVYPHVSSPRMNVFSEYRPLNEFARRLLASYARHIARIYDPELKDGEDSKIVRSIKIYRVLHQMLEAADFEKGEDPFHPATYFPYYLGEFDSQGRMTPESYSDGLLYWVVPIIRKNTITIRSGQPDTVANYLAIHAGSDPFEESNK